jgi:hypothetical protein
MDNLYKKISNVMAKIEYLKKDDSISTGSGSYKALSEEKVTESVRKALIEEGLVILPVEQMVSRETFTTEKEYNNTVTKSNNHLTTIEVHYKIVNVDDPKEFEILVSTGTGVDTQDKGIGKAMTYAYKYMLLRTFAIPSGDDPDKISSEVYTNNLEGKADKKPEPKPETKTIYKPQTSTHLCGICGKVGSFNKYKSETSKHDMYCINCLAQGFKQADGTYIWKQKIVKKEGEA